MHERASIGGRDPALGMCIAKRTRGCTFRGGREGGREEGREGRREGGKEGGREGGREGRREGGKSGMNAPWVVESFSRRRV
jgi:hypothetical protein